MAEWRMERASLVLEIEAGFGLRHFQDKDRFPAWLQVDTS
jgi:hypothetical protein